MLCSDGSPIEEVRTGGPHHLMPTAIRFVMIWVFIKCVVRCKMCMDVLQRGVRRERGDFKNGRITNTRGEVI